MLQKTLDIAPLGALAAGLLIALLVGVGEAEAQDLNDSAIQNVESLENGAKRVVIKQNATWSVSIGSGETFSDLLIDIDRPGADFVGRAYGTGWTIRNIGVKGETKATQSAYVFALSGKNNTVEHVYLGDGAETSRTKAFWTLHDDTDGPIDFRRIHVSGFPNNGIYGSPTVEDKRGGVLHIYDSYFDSNNITNFKLGSPHGSCEVVNTVVRTDNPTTPINGQVNKRAMWALDNPGGGHPNRHRVVLRDVDIEGTIQAEPGAIVELENTRWDGDFIAGGGDDNSGDPDGELVGQSVGTPDLTPPEGVPMTARKAAIGEGSDQQPSEPEDPMADLPGVVESVTVDGRLDDPDWQAVDPLTFDDSTDESDNTVELRGLWDDTSLYLGWTVEDATVETDTTAAPHEEDGVELLLDSENDGGYDLRPDDLQVILSVDEKLKADLDGNVSAEDIGLDSAVRETADGYVIEMKVDWAPLGGAPEVDDRMGALFANADLDDGDSARQFAQPEIFPFKNPERFAPIAFVAGDPSALPDDEEPSGDDAGSSTADAGSGIADTGPAPDTFAGHDAGRDSGGHTAEATTSNEPNVSERSSCANVGGRSPAPDLAWLLVLGALGLSVRSRRPRE